ncbi:ATP-binding protein [Sulfitobacter sp. LCG007]
MRGNRSSSRTPAPERFLSDEGYDLSGLKAIDSFRGREIRLRLLLLGVAALAVTLHLRDPVFPVAYGAYVVILATYIWLLQRQADRVPRRRMLLLAGVGQLSVLIVQCMCVYLFANEDRIAQLLALFLYFVSSLNTVTVRAIRRSYLSLEIVSYILAGAAMVVVEFDRSPIGAALIIAVAFAAYSSYFIFTTRGVQRFQRQLEEKWTGVHEAERQRAIGQLTAGIGHDFNNLLATVIGNIQLCREVEDEAERAALLAAAEQAAYRGADLTGRLLALSRQSHLEPEKVDTDRIAQDLSPVANRVLGSKHRLVIDLPPRPLRIEVDAGMLTTVLINLILNARDAMPGGGDIVLSGEAGRNASTTLTIRDTGTGILPENLDRIFEPYFTTKPNGSGLGLSMARGFMEQSGGTLELETRPGKGTAVRLRFPPC